MAQRTKLTDDLEAVIHKHKPPAAEFGAAAAYLLYYSGTGWADGDDDIFADWRIEKQARVAVARKARAAKAGH
jgi:hypothetical protein